MPVHAVLAGCLGGANPPYTRQAEPPAQRQGSTARWNLKEAVTKTLARRTEIAYEAVAAGEKANIFKARQLRDRAARFRLSETKRLLEELAVRVRIRLRVLLWQQWKRAHTRARNLVRVELDEERAWRSAPNGRGP